MSNQWKQYGGLSKIDKFQHLTIGTLVADQVLLREKVATVTRFNTTIEVNPGELNVLLGNVNAINVNSQNNLSVVNNAFIGGKITIGSNNNFLYSTSNGIGINNDNPQSTFDIYGNLIVRSGTNYIRNIIAQNNSNKGIAVTVNNNTSYVDFFNISNVNTNVPDS
jgi:hypothetical protein